MKRFRILMIGLLLTTVNTVCRKTDHSVSGAAASDPATRFFSSNASHDPFIQSLTDYVKRENSKYRFVEAIISKIGYPQWDKAMVLSGEAASRSGITDADSVHITCIPFVRDSQQYVNATLALATAPGDTSVKILCDWQYRDTAATGLSKSRFALTMMNLDQAVFGNRLYRLTDTTVFDHRARYIRLNPVQNRKTVATGGLSLLEWVYSFTICWTEYVPINNGQVTGCAPGPDCPFYTEEQSCIEISWSSGGGSTGGGGGTGGGSGGSGGGSGGGWVPPSNPNPCPGVAARTQVPAGCGVGWVPGGGNPPPADPVDSMLARYSRRFRHIGDSIYYNHSLPANREYFFAGARKNTNNDTVMLNIRTDYDSTSVRPNLSVPGHTLLFIWHSHVSASLNTADRRSFSHADIDYLRNPTCLKLNFVSFADCNNKKYALVITDVAKAQTFFNIHNRAFIEDNFWTTGGGNMQEVDERCVKNIIGSAAVNGISFYVSTNVPNFSTWTLLNP